METSKMKREATINRMAVQMGNLTHDDLASRVVAMIIECEGRVNRIQETMELVLEAHRQCIMIHHLGKDIIQHRKGGIYELAVPIARVQTDTPIVDYAEVSVYRANEDGSWWVRPNTEMGDGRFRIIESRPAPEAPPLTSSSVWTMDKVILAPGEAVARIRELEDRLFEKMLHESPPPMIIQTTPELIERLKNIGSMNDDQEVARTAYDAVEALSNQDADLRGRIVEVLRNSPEVKHIGKLADEIMAVIPAGEPVAARHSFDGHGFQYIDNGSGSDWKERHKGSELLYAGYPAPSVAVKAEQPEGTVGEMTPDRAIYFLKRFKGEEKLLGPHEQWALDFSIAALSAQVQDVAKPISITLTREQGDTPCPSHGGPAVRVSWVLAINGVEIDREDSRYVWSTTPGVNESRQKEPPLAMASLRDELTEALL